MKAYVGVTDGSWARQLDATGADEVNFWRPSGDRRFGAIEIGEPFYFKLHSPDNRVVGGGIFSGFAGLTLSEAWRFFGTANGVQSLEEMRTRIGRYRRQPVGPGEDPRIGCIFIRDVRFFDSPADSPPDFAGSIVQGKSYDLSEVRYRDYFEDLMVRTGSAVDVVWTREGPMFSEPMLARRRLGQRSFQGVVLSAYQGRCAVTGDRIRPVLQAAHILPVTRGGQHRIDNGLLLRSDVHTLFDDGYLGVTPDYRLMVSPRLREEFGNGEEFYSRARERVPIALPARRIDRPNREYLEWHRDEVFLAG